MSALPEDLVEALGSAALAERLRAEGELAAVGLAAETPLLAALSDATAPEEVRWRAAYLLGLCGSEAAVPLLCAGLRDTHWSVRHASAGALGELGNPMALPPLWVVASAPAPDEQVNYVAAIGLLRIDRAHGEAILRSVAAGGTPSARRTAVSALASLSY